jgi:hypothetical protein
MRFLHVPLLLLALSAIAGCADRSVAPMALATPDGPQRIILSSTYQQVSAGGFLSCALTTAGGVICWGGDVEQRAVPAAAQSGVSQVSAGSRHACALKSGAVICWGRNLDGEATVPSEAQSGVVQVSAGSAYTCAVKSGAVFCWGANVDGRTAVPSEAQSGVVQVSAHLSHACAVKSTGAVVCWGRNQQGESTVPPDAQSGVTQVTGGIDFTCVLKNGAVSCWPVSSVGANVPVAAQSGVTQVDSDSRHSCAVAAGAVVCWGPDFDFSGATTVPAEAQSGIVQVSTGDNHTCALKSTGAVICWGSNERGGQATPPTNVLPTATFTATSSVIVGQPIALSLTDAQVLGFASVTSFTYAFDCGTGSYGAASSDASTSCPTSAAGALTVRGKVIDPDADFTEYTAAVSVLSAEQATIALGTAVGGATLPDDLRKGLSDKLTAAAQAIARGNTTAACGQLDAFIQQVQAQRGKSISAATADAWITTATQIRAALGC